MARKDASVPKTPQSRQNLRDRWLFLLIFLILGSLIAGGIAVVYQGQSKDFREDVILGEKSDLLLRENLIVRRFGDIVTDVLFLTRTACLARGLDSGDYIEAAETFLIFAEAKNRYAQLRYLDRNGLEVVRVDTVDGMSRIIPQADLQNKSDRYYFRDALKYSAGGMYVSPLDLNVENGEIQEPRNPMIRFASPVYRDDELQGVIVVNYAAGPLLEELSTLGHQDTGDFYLLNEDAYYLISPDKEDEWGFMYPDDPGKSSRRFDLMYPDTWDRVQDDESDILTDEYGLLYPRVIRPLYGLEVENKDYHWIAVDMISPGDLRVVTDSLRRRLFRLGGFLFILSAIPSWAVSQIISRRTKQRRELYHSANYDGLTGLPNRQLGMDRLGQLLLICKRYKRCGAVFFIDLDGFKAVNDQHGHDIGDSLLKEVGVRLQAGIRDSDTAVRFGGDEFYVITPFENELGDITKIATKLIDTISDPYLLPGVEVRIGASVGVRKINSSAGDSAEEIIRDADEAMYQAKKAGRGVYSVFEGDSES